MCPTDLGELGDKTFGTTTEKTLELIGVYRACAAACLAEVPPKE